MKSYLAVALVAAVSSYLLTFVHRAFARGPGKRLGFMDYPEDRRVHEKPTPTAGGTALYLAFMVAMGVASQLPSFRPIFEGSSEPVGIVLAATVCFLTGLIDDTAKGGGVSPPAKMAGQVLAGSILYFLGVTMFFFRVPFADFVVLSPDLAPLVTVLWVIVIGTALNYIDGLDGLTAGVVAIAAGAFFIYGDRLSAAGLLAPDNVGPLIAIIAMGVCIGFLPHNIHPAKVFMGDTGALFLGLLMASATMVVGGRTADQFSGQTYFFYAPIFIPVFILGVPIFDFLFSIVRRASSGGGITKADKGHLHHRLMELGHGQRRSVLILWVWTALLSGVVLYPTFSGGGNQLIPFGVAALGVALYTLFHPSLRRTDEPPELQLVGDASATDEAPRTRDLHG